jgi:predicted RNA-binding protein associated with RNAse of E/G family
MEPIVVVKRNHVGQELMRYTGALLENGGDFVRLEARFDRADMPFQDTVFRLDDRFVETYYTARWYNIFEIHDRDDNHIKGWYCNLGRPMVWDAPGVISYIDLALDLWVSSDGRQTVLDEDEYEALGLDEPTRAQVQAALAELQALFAKQKRDGG